MQKELDQQYKEVKVALESVEKLKKDISKIRDDVAKQQQTLDNFIEQAGKQSSATHETEQANHKHLDIIAKDVEDLRRGFHKIIAEVDDAKSQSGKSKKTSQPATNSKIEL